MPAQRSITVRYFKELLLTQITLIIQFLSIPLSSAQVSGYMINSNAQTIYTYLKNKYFMMKDFFKLITMTCLLAILLTCNALADVPATPNQRLSFRTGPNTKYVELYTLPQSTQITAIEYEEGNGVTWVLVEYEFEGKVCRAYTGLKRMTVHGDIPWASNGSRSAAIGGDFTVLAAPVANAAYRGQLYDGDVVEILDYEGSYAWIEFYDYEHNAPSRGYILADVLDYTGPDDTYDQMNGSGLFGRDIAGIIDNPRYVGEYTVVHCDEWVSLRARPDTSSERLVKVPKWSVVDALIYDGYWYECYYEGYHGYILAQYLTDSDIDE